MSTRSDRANRRRFLCNPALAGAGFLFLKSARSVWSAAANETLSIALVGVGGRGHRFTSMGHQGTAAEPFRRALELSRSGWTLLTLNTNTEPSALSA